MTLTAVVTTHNHPRLLASILGQLRYQTHRPDEILVYFSRSEKGQTYDIARFREEFPEAQFIETENFRDWGHSKRAMGIDAATSDYIGFFDDDDRYDRRYVEKMMAVLEASNSLEVVFCNWSYQPTDCGFHLGSSTSGNFFVGREKAQALGWASREYVADGAFINRLVETNVRITKLPENLYEKDAYDRGDWGGPYFHESRRLQAV